MTFQEELGKRLKALMRIKNLTVPQVIATLDGKGPTKSYLYRMTQGAENPTVDMIKYAVEACGSTLADFFSSWGSGGKSAEEIESENAQATAIFQELLKDPVSRAGVIASVLAIDARVEPRQRSAQSKK